MSPTSSLPSVATSVIPHYGTTSLSLAPFEPAIIATMTPSPTISIASGALSTATSMIVSVATAAIASSDHQKGSNSDAENGECELLGPFSIVIQAALGGLALLSLVFKRWRERPQRPLKIWGFDVSKQVVGSVLLHLANLAMSMFSSGQLTVTPATVGDYTANPCSFYLLNLAIDVSRTCPSCKIHPLTVVFCIRPQLVYLFSLYFSDCSPTDSLLHRWELHVSLSGRGIMAILPKQNGG